MDLHTGSLQLVKAEKAESISVACRFLCVEELRALHNPYAKSRSVPIASVGGHARQEALAVFQWLDWCKI